MANRARGELGVTIGDQRYTLRPSFDGLCELEDATGKDIDAMLEQMTAGKLSGVRAVIFAVLQAEHQQEIRTLKDASAWIERLGEERQMAAAVAARDLIIELFALNDTGAGEKPPDPPIAQAAASDSTGANSVSVPANAA